MTTFTAEIDAMTTAGAYVVGRNMFGPRRGEWDLDWTGWWGPEPLSRVGVRGDAPSAGTAAAGIVPITLGRGERIFEGVTTGNFEFGHVRRTDHVVHLTLLARRESPRAS